MSACNTGASRGAGTKCDCKPTGFGFDLQLRNLRKLNIYLNFIFPFFAVVSKQKVALSSAIQHAMQNSAERSALTLGFLCLPCCVRVKLSMSMHKIYHVSCFKALSVSVTNHI